jgi:DNA-binding transcriptional MocR family regulator
MKAVTDFGTPLIAQMVGARLLPQIDTVAERRRAELGERLEVLTAALAEHLPDWHCPRPAGGMSVWAQMPSPRGEELVRRATTYGVGIVAGSTFAVDHHQHTDRIRLPFVAEPAVIEEGIRRLGDAWASLERRGARLPSPALVV